ncbi:hypothetical protein TNCV_1498771 [Trichonephila clavipes]|nr:hypothetical protein TNCV_1498771 [Trichonephila clavipes]
MFKNCRREDRIVALELGETVAEKVTTVERTEIIKENKYFMENVEFVKELIQYTIQDSKNEEEYRNKAEKVRLRENELELARLHVGVNSDNERTVSDKIFSTLEKEVASLISVRAENDWFRPLELAKEIYWYNNSRRKSLKPLPNVLTRNNPEKKRQGADWKCTRIYNPQRRLRVLVERCRKDSSPPPRRNRYLFEGLKWPEINYVTNSKKT